MSTVSEKTQESEGIKSVEPNQSKEDQKEQKIETEKQESKEESKNKEKPKSINQQKKQARKNVSEFLTNMTSLKKVQDMTNDKQIERLTTHVYVNPYEVLMLGPEATEEEIKKQYKQLSVLIHPDKNKKNAEKATEAFHVLEDAYKKLLAKDKRQIYSTVMREAQERVEIERKRANKRRIEHGLPALPEDTLSQDVTDMCQRLFSDIQSRQDESIKLEQSYKQRKRDLEKQKKVEDQAKEDDDKEWEKTRDQRVQGWRAFNDFQKNRRVKFGKQSGIHAPTPRPEKRPEKPGKGLSEDYKKMWR